MNCRGCGGTLLEIETWEGEREFTLYQCQDCGETGGEASGAGLPDASWGALGERIVADGGSSVGGSGRRPDTSRLALLREFRRDEPNPDRMTAYVCGIKKTDSGRIEGEVLCDKTAGVSSQ